MLALEGAAEGEPRSEGVAEPADEPAHAFAVGAEVADGVTDRPRRALDRHRDLARGGRAAHGAEPLHRRLAGPAQHPAAGARRHESLIQMMGDEIERVVD